MKKLIGLIVAIVLSVLVVKWFQGIRAEIAEGAPAPAPVAPAPIVNISMVDLAHEYAENKWVAGEKYKDVTLHISGEVVDAIDKDYLGGRVLQLKTHDEYSPGEMNMADDQKDALVKLKKGDKVKVVCETIYCILAPPSGNDCRLVS